MADPSVLAHGEPQGTPLNLPEAVSNRRFFLIVRIVTIIAVSFTFGNALWAAWDQGTTYDEFYHLEWPRRLLHERIDERDSAFRFDSKTPALLPAVLTMDALQVMGAVSEPSLRFASRLTPILYLALCLGLVAAVASAVSPLASWFAVLLVALDPNMAAHASIATSDVGYAAACLLLAWAMVKATASWTSEVMIGVALGVAFAIKYTAVLLVMVALGFVAWRGRHALTTLPLRLLVMTGSTCLTVSVLYLWVGIGAPLGTVQFLTPRLQALSNWLPSLPLPFPRAVLTGLDRSMDHDSHQVWNGYLFGQNHPGGVWYYFVVHWLMKTPLALGVAMLIGLWQMRGAWRHKAIAIPGVLFGIHLIYLSFVFRTQLGLRYALLCIPLAAAIAGCGLATFTSRSRFLLVALVALTLAERAPYWGDPIAFTNLAVWPKSRAYWYTADSNLDYGQNRERLTRYVKESRRAAITDQATVTPGLYVVSANSLTKFGNFRTHRWLIDQNIPAIRFGFTDFGFSITGERFEAYMNDTRVVPALASFASTCSGDLPHYPPGAKLPFARHDAPEDGRLWVVCARSRKGIDLGFTVEQGRLLFGAVVAGNACTTEFLQANQQAWWRVPPGGAVQLCLREIPYRRAFLPYSVSGYVTVRGQGADVDIRSVPSNSLSTRFGLEAVP